MNCFGAAPNTELCLAAGQCRGCFSLRSVEVYHDWALAERLALAYSVLRHIARSVFFSGWRKAYIAVFTAYFDASGTPRTRVLTVAGFVSSVGWWDRYDVEWKRLLATVPAQQFHMTDFVSSQGPFGLWKGRSIRRAKFFAELVRCICKNTRKGFAVSVQISDYNKVNQQYQLRERLGSPYSFCGLVCLAQVREWAKKKHIDLSRIRFLIEDGDEDQQDFIDRAKQENFNLSAESKQAIRAFDACDLAAWKSKTAIDDTWNRKLHLTDPSSADRIKRSLDQLETFVSPEIHGMYTRNSLLKCCFLLKVPKRSGV